MMRTLSTYTGLFGGVSPLLKGELGRIEGIKFSETSPNVNVEIGGSIQKRLGHSDMDMNAKFKEIDEKIKKEWGK